MCISKTRKRGSIKLVIDIPENIYECVKKTIISDEIFDEIVDAFRSGVSVDTCGDCVSRKDVIKAVYDWLEFYDPFEPDEPDLDDVLGNLPSVEPEIKVGRWEYYWNCYYDKYFEYYKCSECDRIIKVVKPAKLINYPYCHCGARMEVDG